MKAKYLIACAAILGLGASSCSDQMNYHEYAVADKDYVEMNFGNVGGFLTQLYKNIEYDFGNFSNGAMSASATDEAEYSKIGNAIEDFYDGGWTPTNAKSATWANMYTGIQAATRFLADFQGLNFDELKLNADYPQQMARYNNYQYEARALRAYFYFELVRHYGGVPLIKEVMSPDDINTMSRNSSDEVYQYIFDECDAIKNLIVKQYDELGANQLGEAEMGRINQVGVLAVKARAALYWASPLFNPSNDKERYKYAADCYKELFDACEEQGYGLTDYYEDLWWETSYQDASIAKELLFCARYYKSSDGDNLVETNNYPIGANVEGGKGGNCPTQNLVDAYEMKKTGKLWNEEGSGYDPEKPYKGRDPRFEVSIAVNGDNWPEYDKKIKLEMFQGGANAQPLTNASTTGYYLKKLCNGQLYLGKAAGKKTVSRHTYLNYRYGGALLDYAEAVYQYSGNPDQVLPGHKWSAREAVNMVRGRKSVKMPEIPATVTGEAFWEKLKNERFVELAFEGHRFFDVRRWKEADKYFKSITRMIITKDADGKLTYTRQDVPRMWKDCQYLFPIPQSEIQKNPNLEQNPGW